MADKIIEANAEANIEENKQGEVSETSNQDTQDQDNKNLKVEDAEEGKNPEIKDEVFETAKDSTAGRFDTLTLIQEVAKYEAKIDAAKSGTVNEKDFYKDLKTLLTDSDLQLRFEDDQTPYIEAVNAAKEKWLKENSVDTSEQEKTLEAVKSNLVIAKAIDTVLKDTNHKDFNFVKLQDFYTNDLTKKEQATLDKGSSPENLSDYFKKIHAEYKKRNPKIVKNVEAPNITDVTNVSRTSVEDVSQINQTAADKKYIEKIGFRRL